MPRETRVEKDARRDIRVELRISQFRGLPEILGCYQRHIGCVCKRKGEYHPGH